MNAVTQIREGLPVDGIEAPAATAPHVLIAMSNVMAEIGAIGISKGRKNKDQGYNFRGIDDIYNELNSIMTRNRLLMIPVKVVPSYMEKPTKSGGSVNYTRLTVDWLMASALDGSTQAMQTVGEAMDSADKASNKAQSGAQKYAALMVFMIPTEGDNDADASHHETLPSKPAWVVSAKASIECLNTGDECGDWYKKNVGFLKEKPKDERDEVLAYLKQRKEAVAVPPAHAQREQASQREQTRASGADDFPGDRRSAAGNSGSRPSNRRPEPGSPEATPFDDEIPF